MKRLAPIAFALAALACPLRAALSAGDSAVPLIDKARSGAAVPETAGRVVVLDFWASWCAPCRASFPAYARLSAQYGSKGLVVVAVSVDQSVRDYDGFVRRNAPGFFVMRDADQSLVRLAEVPTMPTSFLIGRDGRVRFIHQGYHGAETERLLRAELEQLLSEPSP